MIQDADGQEDDDDDRYDDDPRKDDSIEYEDWEMKVGR